MFIPRATMSVAIRMALFASRNALLVLVLLLWLILECRILTSGRSGNFPVTAPYQSARAAVGANTIVLKRALPISALSDSREETIAGATSEKPGTVIKSCGTHL